MTPQELKASILQLAIQGKLVEQCPEEGTGEELYRQIQAEKQHLIKAGTIKKEKPLPEIEEDEIPFEIPNSWVWIRLGTIVKSISAGGDKPKIFSKSRTAECSVPVISNGETNKGIFGYTDKAEITERSLTVSGRGTIGYAEIRTEPYVPIVRLLVITPLGHTYLEYIKIAIQASTEYGVGSAVKQLTVPMLVPKLIPLPPLAEQKRIVAKIKELLPLIDRYEQAWSKLEEFNKRFPVDMQKSILQMAIQGKLVPQHSEEGTAFSLKEKLHNKKVEWTTAGKILKKAEAKPFLDSDDLFDIPDSWEWVQLSDVSIIQEGAGIRKWQYRDAGTQILCVTNILEGSIDLEKKQLYISTEEYLEKYKHLTLNKGDIVTSCSGGSWGKIAFFDCEDTMMLNTSTLRMRFFDDIADNNYLYYVCKSPFFKRQLELQLSGMQPNFGYAHYSRIVLPLPPLAEQKRIVAKLEEILPLCERLK